MHCFDSLRQYVMCTAGDTLLHSWGRNTTGDGSLGSAEIGLLSETGQLNTLHAIEIPLIQFLS